MDNYFGFWRYIMVDHWYIGLVPVLVIVYFTTFHGLVKKRIAKKKLMAKKREYGCDKETCPTRHFQPVPCEECMHYQRFVNREVYNQGVTDLVEKYGVRS